MPHRNARKRCGMKVEIATIASIGMVFHAFESQHCPPCDRHRYARLARGSLLAPSLAFHQSGHLTRDATQSYENKYDDFAQPPLALPFASKQFARSTETAWRASSSNRTTLPGKSHSKGKIPPKNGSRDGLAPAKMIILPSGRCVLAIRIRHTPFQLRPIPLRAISESYDCTTSGSTSVDFREDGEGKKPLLRRI